MKYLELDLGGGVMMKLAQIKPGRFIVGSPKGEEFGDWAGHEKQHSVEITKPYYMGVYEVTQKEFERVMGKNPSWYSRLGGGKKEVAGLDTSRFPVEKVSWDDAMEFCRKLSAKENKTFDLPTEAEWEYACRAGSMGPFHHGNLLSSNQANFNGVFPYGGADKGLFLAKTIPVGSYAQNAFGLYDMHGNVWEWCKDRYSQTYYQNSPRLDPTGPSNGPERVLRGGSWRCYAKDCRSAFRIHSASGSRNDDAGFRLVLRLP